MPPLSLITVLSELPDPRHRQGKVHPLPAVLSLVVLGLLMGRKSLSSIARLGRLYGTPLAHALGFRRGKTPCKSTLSEILRDLDPHHLEELLSRWVCSRIGRIETLAIDGKTLRGSRDGDVPGQHLVAAYASEVEAVIAQIRVDSKTNEHKAALELLGLIDVQDKLVTADAMFCQRDLAGQIIEQGGDYLLVVKDNQEGLKIDISAGFGYARAAESIHVATGGEKNRSGKADSPPCQKLRQSAWTPGDPRVVDHRDSDVAPEVAGDEAGTENPPRTEDQRQSNRRNRLRGHFPDSPTGRCKETAGITEGALED